MWGLFGITLKSILNGHSLFRNKAQGLLIVILDKEEGWRKRRCWQSAIMTLRTTSEKFLGLSYAHLRRNPCCHHLRIWRKPQSFFTLIFVPKRIFKSYSGSTSARIQGSGTKPSNNRPTSLEAVHFPSRSKRKNKCHFYSFPQGKNHLAAYLNRILPALIAHCKT